MLTLTIDGRQVEAPEGTTVLAAARHVGIVIPTLCDHPALNPSGGCRLCVVQVHGTRDAQAACTLPVGQGMIVATDTPALRASRQSVLSNIFGASSHVCAFCPVSGGDCELQNAAYHERMTHWPSLPAWQPRAIDASSAYFVFDPNRCILCRRCVRACAELVGNFTLGVEERDGEAWLVADDGLPFGDSSCVACGACLQVCPTGALYGRRSAYQGLSAQTQRTASVCAGCSVGCGIEIVTRDDRLVRIDGHWASPVSGGLLCRIGRFEPLEETRRRLPTPLVRRGGSLVPATWDDALQIVAAALSAAGSQLAGLISTRLPTEALAAFRQLFGECLHSPLVTSIEEGRTGTRQPARPWEADLAALGRADVVVIIGADVERNHQVTGFVIKRSVARGTRLIVIDPHETTLDRRASQVLRPAVGADGLVLEAWLKALAPGAPEAEADALAAQAGLRAGAIAQLVRTVTAARRPVVVYGKGLTVNQPKAVQLLAALARATDHLRLLGTRGEANSRAAAQMGLDQAFRPAAGQVVYLALGDDYAGKRLAAAVEQAQFLAVQASYYSRLTERADVVLPVETWVEQSGHYLNLEGRLQLARRALQPPSLIRSNQAVLESLAERLGFSLDGDWQSALGAGSLTAANPN